MFAVFDNLLIHPPTIYFLACKLTCSKSLVCKVQPVHCGSSRSMFGNKQFGLTNFVNNRLHIYIIGLITDIIICIGCFNNWL